MKIKYNYNELFVPFIQLSVGDCFEDEGCYFMKVDDIRKQCAAAPLNAIDLQLGKAMTFLPDVLVKKLNGAFVVERDVDNNCFERT